MPYRTRSFGHGMLWFFLTLGAYVPYWYYVCHRDLRAYSGRGIGGPWAATLFFVVSPVTARSVGLVDPAPDRRLGLVVPSQQRGVEHLLEFAP